jgi:hypothetical protein
MRNKILIDKLQTENKGLQDRLSQEIKQKLHAESESIRTTNELSDAKQRLVIEQTKV